ncbi:MAG: hypothetical protein AVDCRST_MAG13-725 [uncultured Solirubrobacteraceae bacterium]|uniref:Uncharacterized protein n=1 Tax=uncultured Solirubrobacteraceae bacterium TaxID=1162706 RepID=A0A6J4RRY9_9ACTN|nr:MAG: hypothetical protein AVDCRST_MAG13-725 [uncultured Solirubrobacteraceae bacterium]
MQEDRRTPVRLVRAAVEQHRPTGDHLPALGEPADRGGVGRRVRGGQAADRAALEQDHHRVVPAAPRGGPHERGDALPASGHVAAASGGSLAAAREAGPVDHLDDRPALQDDRLHAARPSAAKARQDPHAGTVDRPTHRNPA